MSTGRQELGCNSTSIAASGTSGQGVLSAIGLRLVGFSARETAGAAQGAVIVLRHGTGVGSPALVFIKLGQDGSDTAWFGPDGMNCQGGVFVHRVEGTSEIVIYTKPIP